MSREYRMIHDGEDHRIVEVKPARKKSARPKKGCTACEFYRAAIRESLARLKNNRANYKTHKEVGHDALQNPQQIHDP